MTEAKKNKLRATHYRKSLDEAHAELDLMGVPAHVYNDGSGVPGLSVAARLRWLSNYLTPQQRKAFRILREIDADNWRALEREVEVAERNLERDEVNAT